MDSRTLGKLAAAAVVGGVAYSEIAHNVERKITPISAEASILPHEVTAGPHADSPVLFFLHGWPDDVALFRSYVKELSKTYFCVNCTLPGYPTPQDFAGHAGTMPIRNWGYDLDEAMRSVRATIDYACKAQMQASRVGVTLVLHDWGCIVGNLVVDEYVHNANNTCPATHRLDLHRMISMDVGALSGGLNAGVFLMCLAYQLPLNLFWMMPTSLGNALTTLESVLLMRTEAPPSTKPSAVTAAMNWPYRAAWRELATRQPFLGRALGLRPRAGVPVLFLCATDRPSQMRFCDAEYVRLVKESTPLSRTVFMPLGNHWFPNQQTDATLKLCVEWLAETHSYRAPEAKL